MAKDDPSQEAIECFDAFEQELNEWLTRKLGAPGVTPAMASAALVRSAAIVAHGLMMTRQKFLMGAGISYDAVGENFSEPATLN